MLRRVPTLLDIQKLVSICMEFMKPFVFMQIHHKGAAFQAKTSIVASGG